MTIKSQSRRRSKAFRLVNGVIAVLILTFVTSCSSQGVTFASGTGQGQQSVSDEGGSGSSGLPDSGPVVQLVDITFEGGTGKAHVISPVEVTYEGGKSYAKLVFSSKNYDYAIVDGGKYENETPGENSTFTVPVKSLDEPLVFIADTTAMSTPHEIEYRIIWNKSDDGMSSFDEEGTGDAPAMTLFGIRQAGNDRIIAGEKPDGRLDLKYANGFDVLSYGTYRLIRIYGVGDYLLVPEDEAVPEGLDEDITVLMQPLDATYLVSTSVMDLVCRIGAMDHVRLSGLEASDWHIDEARSAMEAGKIIYAGKYRAPDYELILSEGCRLAIENTMIYHDPEVKEKLEELGIPVIVETSSYESDPLGRLEWIKLYGVLYGKEDEADDFYDKEVKVLEEISGAAESTENGQKSVAFFYVTATGTVNARAPKDYVTKMIEAAGGRYVPEGAGDATTGMGTVNMQPEDFFAAVKDADIIIYNSTIEGQLSSTDDLIALNPLFAQFKAVKEGNVYCLDSGFFQKTTKMPEFISDLSALIEGRDGPNGVFIKL